MSDRLITVAIHTYDRAVALKNLLEGEGIHVSLQNVNLDQPVVASGVRVRIKESDLPLALRIIENIEIFANHTHSTVDYDSIILVPVDFSHYSEKACDFAFHFAAAHKSTIQLLHSYVGPDFANTIQLSDVLTYDVSDPNVSEAIGQEATRKMNEFVTGLKNRIKRGELPPVKFQYEVTEGLPEEIINQYAKEHNPLLIVMGTRGVGTKERELIGSVTAEVLDTCRFPVFTVPESVNMHSLNDIKHAVFFSNLEQEDILALDSLHRMFRIDNLKVTLVNIPSKKQNANISGPIESLFEYCKSHYLDYQFNLERLEFKTIEADYDRISRQSVDLIVVPNKKKNIFARLFNPGIAHRLLFHSDIAMMVIPV